MCRWCGVVSPKSILTIAKNIVSLYELVWADYNQFLYCLWKLWKQGYWLACRLKNHVYLHFHKLELLYFHFARKHLWEKWEITNVYKWFNNQFNYILYQYHIHIDMVSGSVTCTTFCDIQSLFFSTLPRKILFTYSMIVFLKSRGK